MLPWLMFPLFLKCNADLAKSLSSPVRNHFPPKNPLISPISYDLQLQFPLSEITDPDIPLFTGRFAMQFQLNRQIGPQSDFLSESTLKHAKLKLDIYMLDHFENVSLVYNGEEIGIYDVHLTDYSMEISLDQQVLFPGRYTLSAQRYKGLIGNSIYYRDAGEHAVFGSSLFPHRAPAVFPTVDSAVGKASFAVTVVHPLGTTAITSSPEENTVKVDKSWQTTPPLTPSMLAFSLLPTEFSKVDSTYTGITLSIWYNRFRVHETQAKQILNIANQVFAILIKAYPKSKISDMNLILMNDIVSNAVAGVLFISEEKLIAADHANQIYLMANWMIRQWLGGQTSIDDASNMCLQEDLIAFLAMNMVKRMTDDDFLQTAQLAKVYLTESIFNPGDTLTLNEHPIESEIYEKCGLKGVSMFDSLTSMIGEKAMASKVKSLLKTKGGSYTPDQLFQLFNDTVDGDILLSQVLDYWRSHGGLPHMNVNRLGFVIELDQNGGNFTVKNGKNTWERMPAWPLPYHFDAFQLPSKLMLSQSVKLSPIRDGQVLANLGFTHYYRVNYDLDTWRDVMKSLTENATLYTVKERFQLLSDFCYFYSIKTLPEPAATKLKDQFLKLIDLRPADFPLCDAALFMCHPKYSPSKKLDNKAVQKLRKRIFDSLTNSSDGECRSGRSHEAFNDLCVQLFGSSCL